VGVGTGTDDGSGDGVGDGTGDVDGAGVGLGVGAFTDGSILVQLTANTATSTRIVVANNKSFLISVLLLFLFQTKT